jgi:hypothetical protein
VPTDGGELAQVGLAVPAVSVERLHVVDLAPVEGAAAVGEGAGRPDRAEGEALAGGGDASGPSEVEGDGLAAQDEGDDPGVAGHAAGD